MPDLTQDQVEKQAAIQKSATVWGVIAGGIVGLVALWLLGGQGGPLRFGGSIVVALIVGFLVFRASFKSGAKSAQCEKCGAAFSRSRTDHVETLELSTPRDEREEQADKSTKVTTWTEDSFDVVDTYTCAKCGDVSTKAYKTTRRRDEETTVEPFETPKQAARSEKGAAAATQKGKSASAKTRSAARRKR